MEPTKIQERWRYMLVGMTIGAASNLYTLIQRSPSWKGEWLIDNLGQIIGGMIAGALLGRFIFWIKNRKS